jgi:hypothetical protein
MRPKIYFSPLFRRCPSFEIYMVYRNFLRIARGLCDFFPKKFGPACGLSVDAGYLTYFLLISLTNGFLINFIQTILLYSYVILNILRHLASNQQN